MPTARKNRNERQSSPPREHAQRLRANARITPSSANSIQSVNWHITQWCNLGCRFCYQKHSNRPLPHGPRLSLSLADGFLLLEALDAAGCRKITFAGGEPTLVPELPALIRHAWAIGIEVMIVTNGYGVTKKFLEETRGCIAAVKLSIDSPSEATLVALGRSRGDYLPRITSVADLCHLYRVPVMMNTVVTRLNWEEDLHSIVTRVRPVRWKVFQALWVGGQNTAEEAALAVSLEQFREFLHKHRDMVSLVPEDNDAMTESYVMVDPWGRFFQNTGGSYTRSREILEVGVEQALADAGGWDRKKFVDRGGNYEFSAISVTRPVEPSRAKPPTSRYTEVARPGSWRIRIDSRAEIGALYNLKGRLFDWFRNNPEGNPGSLRIRVSRGEMALFIEAADRESIRSETINHALQYAKNKATKSQRYVAGCSAEQIVK
jgi:radical S-adenosyl methionine domain-containing protein 2